MGKFCLNAGIPEIAFINCILFTSTWIFSTPANFIFKIHMVNSKFNALIIKNLFNTSFISPAFFRVQCTGCSLLTIIRIYCWHLKCLADINIPRNCIVYLIQCLKLRIQNPFTFDRIINNFAA